MTRDHDRLLWGYCLSLRRRGHRIATEVGLPGARLDAVRLDRRGRWLEIYELKLNNAAQGVEQLLRYAALAPDEPRLRLIVTPRQHSKELAAAACANGIEYEVCFGVQEPLLWEWPNGTYVHLPSLHPESARRAAAKNSAHYWAKVKAAA